jgi:hypothetical protein
MRHVGSLLSFSIVGAVTAFVVTATPACSGKGAGFVNKETPDEKADAGPKAPDLFTDEAGTKPCVNLECQKKECPGGDTTSLTGVVYDPAGKTPLYNAIVYIPNKPLEDIPEGVTCDKCGGALAADPVAVTLTNAAGEFELQDVPVGKDIPLVIQVGKWRREVIIPEIKECRDNHIKDRNLTRLPRNQQEGHIPQMLLATGGCDALMCLMRKIGLDDSEFTTPSGKGRVHMIKANGGGGVTGTPDAQPVWSDINQLQKYDMMLLSCECDEYPENKPAIAKEALRDYANMGGKVFATHYHYEWLKHGVAEFQQTATWNGGFGGFGTDYDVDMSFPKGKAFAEWLVATGASTTLGKVRLEGVNSDVGEVNKNTSTSWIYGNDGQGGGRSVKYYSFNAPLSVPDDEKCGKVVFSDLHVASGDSAGGTFPAACTTTDLEPQEKALEFLLFDLSGCVQNEKTAPTPPK